MQKINYDAIVKNARYFKRLLGKSKLCAVVKNDAYGHGIVRTAGALCGVADCFAVGNLEEALKVADFGEVLILLPLTARDVPIAVSNNFILTVDSFDTLDTVIGHIGRGKPPRIHIKINSGMNRLGFTFEQLPKLIGILKKSGLQAEGIFSHFYGCEVCDCDRQTATFKKCCKFIQNEVPGNYILHLANTTGALLSPNYRFDMARVGLGLYGYGDENLLPAKTVTAKVIATRRVSAGQTVGYGAAYVFPNDTNVAVIDCGYAHGFPRALCNAKVKINGQICNVVGNVCMAMLTADTGSVPVKIGDDAVLLGDGINNANNNVIVYELLCNLRK
ncbi:MAG: alanine racemase [Corallococcus sp.]|nr:alanine racemase [Corallococcus sp.]MCM1359453.1 alanine racemase [Corallococcus sp.]MCM1394735.1 alanine racemase [Corallococcus sp.]